MSASELQSPPRDEADHSGDRPAGSEAAGSSAPPLKYWGPSSRWRLINLPELWRQRELLWILAQRDIKVRYRQAVVGAAWVVLQPLATSLVFVVLFGLLGHTPADGQVAYGLFVLPGVVLWQLFAGIVSQSTTSLVANQNLIGKVYFPRLLLPLATALTNLIDFSIGLGVLGCVLAWYRFVPSWPVVFLPCFVLLAVLAGLAVGTWMAALNAMYRDAGLLVPFGLQVGFFLSPVIYSVGRLIPPSWQPVLLLNPMCGVIAGFRWSLLGQGPAPVQAILVGTVGIAFTLLTGLAYFRRVEGVLADRI